jgi:integrase/recombinase XerD
VDTTLYEEWLLAQGLDPSTVYVYRGKVAAASRIAVEQGWDLRHMSASQLGSLTSRFPDSHSSRTMLRFALTHYWAMSGVSCPAKAITAPKPPPPRYRGLEDDEAELLEKTALDWWPEGGITLLGLYLALRRSEIAALRWEAFEDGMATVVGKGRRTRYLPVHPILADQLAPHASEGHLFPGEAGRIHIHAGTVALRVTKVCEAAGIRKVNPHALRSTCLTNLYEQTDDIHLVQTFAGHSDPKTTARYTRVTERRMRAAVLTINYRRAA